MGFSNVRQAVEGRFNTQWASATTVYYQGQKGEPDVDENWVRIFMRPAVKEQASIGGATNMHRVTGYIWLQLFTTENENNSVRDGYLQDIVDIFESTQFAAGSGTVLCRDAEIDDLGLTGSWYQTDIGFRYHHDTVS